MASSSNRMIAGHGGGGGNAYSPRDEEGAGDGGVYGGGSEGWGRSVFLRVEAWRGFGSGGGAAGPVRQCGGSPNPSPIPTAAMATAGAGGRLAPARPSTTSAPTSPTSATTARSSSSAGSCACSRRSRSWPPGRGGTRRRYHSCRSRACACSSCVGATSPPPPPGACSTSATPSRSSSATIPRCDYDMFPSNSDPAAT